VIWGSARWRSSAVPFAVGAYITGAYWFASSTPFANPAVTLARSASDTFAGPKIRPALSWLNWRAPPQLQFCFAGWRPRCLKTPRQSWFPILKRKLMSNKKRVLILCTGNSARSHMTEGLLRHDAGERFEVQSAGTKASSVRRRRLPRHV
jgi:hypothetical protein